MIQKTFIIEDDVNTLYALQNKLSAAGFKTATDFGASDDDELYEKIEKFKPDAIILDLLLPRTDGYRLLSRIKKDDELNKVSIFVFTNMSDADSREKCLKIGAECFFVKNKVNIDELIEKIEKITGRKKKEYEKNN